MVISRTRIPGCLKIYPRTLTDDKRWITQTYSWDELRKLDVTAMFKYDGEMYLRYKNTFRGIYYQKEPRSQAMLMHCVCGAALVVVVNINSKSKSYLKYQIFECSETNQIQVYASAGLAIGILALEDETKMQIKSDQQFDVKYQRRLRWDDPKIGIKWPLQYNIDPSRFIISMRDRYADTVYEMFRSVPDAAYEHNKLYAAEESDDNSMELMNDVCGPMPALENKFTSIDEALYTPDAPVLNKLSVGGSGITLSWNTDFFSQGYVVMRRSSQTAEWEDIVTLPRGCCMYTDYDLVPNVKYNYTVRGFAYDRNGVCRYSTYDIIGISASFCYRDTKPEAPELISAKATKGGVMIKWYKVDMVQGYHILRASPDSTEWKVVGEVPYTSDSFLDISADTNENYVYRVQAYTYYKCLGDCQERGIQVQ